MLTPTISSASAGINLEEQCDADAAKDLPGRQEQTRAATSTALPSAEEKISINTFCSNNHRNNFKLRETPTARLAST